MGKLVLGYACEDALPSCFDDFFLFSNQRVKHRNFFGIISLLVFPKEKEVGFVGRPPTMKEEPVFLNNRLAECQVCRSFETRHRALIITKLFNDMAGENAISFLGKVDAVVREWAFGDRSVEVITPIKNGLNMPTALSKSGRYLNR